MTYEFHPGFKISLVIFISDIFTELTHTSLKNCRQVAFFAPFGEILFGPLDVGIPHTERVISTVCPQLQLKLSEREAKGKTFDFWCHLCSCTVGPKQGSHFTREKPIFPRTVGKTREKGIFSRFFPGFTWAKLGTVFFPGKTQVFFPGKTQP